MYIAMNRFRVSPGREEDFERIWRQRRSYLDEVEGFLLFRLLRGEPAEGAVLYVSYSEWGSKESFDAWTESEAFQKAHRQGRSPEGVLLGPPRFEGYEVATL